MKKLDSIKRILSEDVGERFSRRNKHMSRILEGIGSSLPIEFDREILKPKDDGEIFSRKYSFSSREALKDFVSSVQELEDRSFIYATIISTKESVVVERPAGHTVDMIQRTKMFFRQVDSIAESINDE